MSHPFPTRRSSDLHARATGRPSRHQLHHLVPRFLLDLRPLSEPSRVPAVVVTPGTPMAVHVLGHAVEQPPSRTSAGGIQRALATTVVEDRKSTRLNSST